MSTTESNQNQDTTRTRTDGDRTNTNAELTLNREFRLATECVACGTILPIDTGGIDHDHERGEIECPRCRRVERIGEVLLR